MELARQTAKAALPLSSGRGRLPMKTPKMESGLLFPRRVPRAPYQGSQREKSTSASQDANDEEHQLGEEGAACSSNFAAEVPPDRVFFPEATHASNCNVSTWHV